MITVEQLSVYFGGFSLFKKVSFQVTPKDKIGLVGKNGAGKSTMLKIFSGLQEPSEGRISLPKEMTIGYLPQHMVFQNLLSLKEEASKAFEHIINMDREINRLNEEMATRTDYESEGYAQLIESVTHLNERYQLIAGGNFEAEVEKILIGLGFKRSDFERNTGEFSGGWRMRVELAKILLQRPDVLLLDEPTNHLDIESVQWLESFLITYSGAVILVSHDKAFLDNVTNRTIEINLGRIFDFRVPYSKYLVQREDMREQQMRAYQNQQKTIKDTEDFIERFRYKASKAVQVQSRIKQLDKLDRLEVDEVDAQTLNLKFPPAPRSGAVVIEAENLSVGYGGPFILSDISFNIEKGEKIAFVGKNGEGKSTLIKAVMNEIEVQGKLKLGHNVKIGYFAQNQAQLLDENLSVFDTIDHVAVGEIRTKIRNLLGAFMFGGEDVDKKVKVLSGGERSRLAMIKLLLEPVNLLVLDEPTNHLDLRSKDVLKEAIKEFDGTVIVVSHDRDFLDGLANKLYEFKDGKTKEHIGGVYEFLEKKRMENLTELEIKTPEKRDNSKDIQGKSSNNLSYEQRKELSKRIKRKEKEVEKLEATIERLESSILAQDKVLADPANSSDHTLFGKYDATKKELDDVMVKWEKATNDLVILQKEWEE